MKSWKVDRPSPADEVADRSQIPRVVHLSCNGICCRRPWISSIPWHHESMNQWQIFNISRKVPEGVFQRNKLRSKKVSASSASNSLCRSRSTFERHLAFWPLGLEVMRVFDVLLGTKRQSCKKNQKNTHPKYYSLWYPISYLYFQVSAGVIVSRWTKQ